MTSKLFLFPKSSKISNLERLWVIGNVQKSYLILYMWTRQKEMSKGTRYHHDRTCYISSGLDTPGLGMDPTLAMSAWNLPTSVKHILIWTCSQQLCHWLGQEEERDDWVYWTAWIWWPGTSDPQKYKVFVAGGLQGWLLWEAARSFPHVWQSQCQPAPRWTRHCQGWAHQQWW